MIACDEELLDIARQAARNVQRRYSLDWTVEDIEDAAGWAALAQVEAGERIARADNPRRYAFGIAQHAIIDSMLKSRRREPRAQPLREWGQTPAESAAHSAEWAARIDALLTDIFPDRDREIFVLRVAEGLSRGELAARVGGEFGEMHRVLQRCRKRLSRIKEHGNANTMAV